MRLNARSSVAGPVLLRLKRSDEKKELDLAVGDDALSYQPKTLGSAPDEQSKDFGSWYLSGCGVKARCRRERPPLSSEETLDSAVPARKLGGEPKSNFGGSLQHSP